MEASAKDVVSFIFELGTGAGLGWGVLYKIAQFINTNNAERISALEDKVELLSKNQISKEDLKQALDLNLIPMRESMRDLKSIVEKIIIIKIRGNDEN